MKHKYSERLSSISIFFLLIVHVSHAQDFFLKEWWNDKEERFPHHYSEVMGGAKDREPFFGINYTYIPSKLGFYGSFGVPLSTFGHNDFYFLGSIGPTIRLTKSQSTGVDIHLFQGIGLSRERAHEWPHDPVSFVMGETGIRFGFGRDRKFSLWSISGSVRYASNGIGWSAGVSWPIAGVAAASGLIVGAAIVIGSAGVDLSDFGSGKTSTPSSGTLPSQSATQSRSTSSSSTSDCEKYMREYAQQEARVVELLKQKEDYNRYGTSVSKTQANKRLIEAQSKLKKIRREASAHHCSIPVSSAETAGH